MKILHLPLGTKAHRVRLIGAILVVLATAPLDCGAHAQESGAQQPEVGTPGSAQSNDATSRDWGRDTTDDKPDSEAFTDRSAQRFYERLFRRLKRMKPNRENDETLGGDNEVKFTRSGSLVADSTIATPMNDSFVIGTASVNPQTGEASVCFRAVNSVDETARVITGSHGETVSRGEISYWHVFYRVHSETDAPPLLDHLQTRYDEQVAYRNRLMQQYNARSIRRC